MLILDQKRWGNHLLAKRHYTGLIKLLGPKRNEIAKVRYSGFTHRQSIIEEWRIKHPNSFVSIIPDTY